MMISFKRSAMAVIIATALFSVGAKSEEPEFATGVVSISATDTPHIPLLPFSVKEGRAEKRASIIKVDNGKVYVDAGALSSVAVGDVMEIYRMEPLTDLKGNVLEEEEVNIGRLLIEDVRTRVSTGVVIYGGEPPLRGYFVKYWVAEETEQEAAANASRKCPKGMLYDDGGVFEYVPGSVTQSVPAGPPTTGEARAFCVDKNPMEGIHSWATARQLCALKGKRLCDKSEMQKVCGTWDKPALCPLDVKKKGACPEQNVVMDYNSVFEWASDIGMKDGAPFEDAYACSCPGSAPVCSHCFYEQCRGAEKKFRCCAAPLPE